MRCDLRTVKHSLQTVYPFCRSVRSVRIDKPYMTTLDMKIPLIRCNLWTVKHSLQTVYPFCRSVRSVRIDKPYHKNSCHENILSPTNEMPFTDRKTLFTDRIPLLSIRSIGTDRQTVYNSSCHEIY